MFVFYDTETTGTNKVFDQILQFAAILTDEHLNPVDQINLRCRILPWVVPAPAALQITGIMPSQLDDPSLPSFYDMMTEIRLTLQDWSPAIFLGYNSIKFDEPFLHRAFWQCLQPPYLTVSNGNARMDVLALAQAAFGLAPNTLAVPLNEKDAPSFKLDRLAPANGFAHAQAHDALADVEATIHIAALIRERLPRLWDTSVARAAKAKTADLLQPDSPVLVVEYYGKPALWWGQRIDRGGANARNAIMADLASDWRALDKLDEPALTKWVKTSPRPVRALATNKAPVVFSLDEAEAFWSMRPDGQQIANAQKLSGEPSLCKQLVEAHTAAEPEWSKPVHLEELIYEGFPSRTDEARMEAFHRSDWPGRAKLMYAFEDPRLKRLSQRLVYLEAPQCLSGEERANIERGIAVRLHVTDDEDHPWRSLEQARSELSEFSDELLRGNLRTQLTTYFQMLAERFGLDRTA